MRLPRIQDGTAGRLLMEYSNQERVNNTSGYPGVYLMRLVKKDKAGNERCHVSWEARSPTGLKPAQKKSFAVIKYGEARAYELAIEARKAFVAQLDGYLSNGLPEHLREMPIKAGNSIQE